MDIHAIVIWPRPRHDTNPGSSCAQDREKARAAQTPKNPVKSEDFATIEVFPKFKLPAKWR